MIQIQGLVYDYPGHRALYGIDLSIARGAITALVGPNGAGKTTLLRLIAALETPYAGRVVIDGLDTRLAPRAIHERLGYLPDFFGLYEALSVQQCLFYAARAHGIGAAGAAAAAQTAAGRVGLGTRMEQAAGSLSRGLRQRLAIAQAIVHQPKVLLLDEPAAGLDPQARRFRPDVMQVPFSLLDQRLLQDGSLARLKDMGVEIHARSLFLQGLLFMTQPPEKLRDAAPMLRAVREHIAAARSTPLAAALGFVLSRPEVDVAVIGVTSRRELDEILAVAPHPPELPDWAACALADERILTPSRW